MEKLKKALSRNNSFKRIILGNGQSGGLKIQKSGKHRFSARFVC
jgi:hypothetical protein